MGYICRCDAYTFPHAFNRGKCDGWAQVQRIWVNRECDRDCPYLVIDEGMESCYLLEHESTEKPENCPALKRRLREG